MEEVGEGPVSLVFASSSSESLHLWSDSHQSYMKMDNMKCTTGISWVGTLLASLVSNLKLKRIIARRRSLQARTGENGGRSLFTAGAGSRHQVRFSRLCRKTKSF